MQPKLLKKKDISLRFNCGWRKAQRLLAKNGVLPIDVGEGKYKCLRWLESGVDAVILAMHQQAQPKTRKKPPMPISEFKTPLAAMKSADIYNLVAKKTVVQ